MEGARGIVRRWQLTSRPIARHPVVMADTQEIDYNEDYRRSRRNTLFWAAVTICLSLGSSTGAVEIGSLAKNLTFSHALIVAGSLAATGFSFCGYWHARSRLLANHTDFAIAARIGKLADRATAMEDLLQGVFGSIEHADDAIRNQFHNFDGQLRKALTESSIRVRSNKPVQVANEFRSSLESNSQVDIDRFDRFLVDFSSEYTHFLNDIYLEIKLSDIDAIQLEAERGQGQLSHLATKSIEAFQASARTLRVFARDVGRGERAWFRYFYHWPTVGLVVAAALLGGARLYVPSAMDHRIALWGLQGGLPQASAIASPVQEIAATLHPLSSGGSQPSSPSPSPAPSSGN